MKKKVTGLALGLTVLLSSTSGVSANDINSVPYRSTEDRLETALDYINDIRDGMGLDPVTYNPYLTRAADNHLNYLEMNGGSGHTQRSDMRGFTGVNPIDRVEAVGYYPLGVLESLGVGSVRYGSEGLRGLTRSPGHRRAFLSSNVTEVGTALASEGDRALQSTVIKGAVHGPVPIDDVVTYPYDGMTDVPLSFSFSHVNYQYDRVLGDRPHYHNFGTVFSYETHRYMEFEDFSLVSEHGKEYTYTFDNETLDIYPDEPLQEHTDYEAVISFKGDHDDVEISFTTGVNTPEDVINYHNQYMDDGGSYDPIDEPDQEDPRDNANLNLFTDFRADQWWADDMKWAIGSGYIQGFNARNPSGEAQFDIRPNQHLTEAEFLTLIFRQARADILNSKSPQSEWWAEPTYLTAERLNLVTSGNSQTRGGAGDPITRGDAARLLASMHLAWEMSEYDAVMWMYNVDLSDGYTNAGTYEDYRPDEILQRSHIATFMRRYEDRFLN